MSAVPSKGIEAEFQALTEGWLDAVLAVEQRAYAHPWNRTNFLDALQAGYQAQMLVAGDTLLGYFIAMEGVDEIHLLNITVAPEYQGQGWARILLDARPAGVRGPWLPARRPPQGLLPSRPRRARGRRGDEPAPVTAGKIDRHGP